MAETKRIWPGNGCEMNDGIGKNNCTNSDITHLTFAFLTFERA